MIIDCHGHYTTVPRKLHAWRDKQIASIIDGSRKHTSTDTGITDDEIRETIEASQLKLQRERGTDLTLFSPIAGAMAHHIGDQKISEEWTRVANDTVLRVTKLFPKSFIPVCQLPQSTGVPAANCIPELERCVKELGFVGCNLSPDPSGGYWKDPPLTDRKHWYPLYEKLVELDVPAMIHVSSSCNPCFHGTGAHYINGDTTAFMQLIQGDLFKDFPTLKFIIPHGGGAVPFHWGRYRGLAQDMKKPPLEEHLLKNVYFDTCVYHAPGVELMAKVIPIENILFASEMVGAVRGVDPRTGHNYDDTKRYVDQAPLTAAQKTAIYSGNTRRVFARLDKALKERGLLS